MANTYKALSTVTVGAGGAASISFTNIPQTYTDLVVKLSPKTTRTDADYEGILCSINSNTTDASYYRQVVMNNSGSAVAGAGADRYVGWTATNSGTAANVFGNFDIYFPNYASSTTKVYASDFVNEGNFSAVTAQGLFSNSFSTSAAITSITFTTVSANNFTQYTTATLYGVFNADVSSAPATPTIGTATAENAQALITFTGVSNAASYTMTSTPSSITGTGTTSPITVTGLTNGTAYTFKVKSNNPFGSSAESAASNSVTPAAYAYESLASSVVSDSTTSVITFSNIPSTYKHLEIRMAIRTDRANAQDKLLMRFNGDTGANYYYHLLYGNISSLITGWSSGAQTSIETPSMAGDSAAANNFGSCIITVQDYANTNKKKTAALLGGTSNSSTSMFVGLFGGHWTSTNAITSVSFNISGGTYFKTNSTISLYGIKGA